MSVGDFRAGILLMSEIEHSGSRRLSDLETSHEAMITKVFGHGSFRKRITEMGFVRGKRIRVVKNAPLMDPVEYEIMGYHIALRRSEAELIEVSECPIDDISTSSSDGTFEQESANRFFHSKSKVINVALVGNPNAGKTSLFNISAGVHERVGNYSGVTVDAKSATFERRGYTINVVDLPGTYSITEYSPEELYVRNQILDHMPDVVVNVVDATNLERNLFLTTQLIDMDIKVVMALNMYDELQDSGAELDYATLGEMIGIPIVPTVASRGQGVDELFDTVIDAFEDNQPIMRHIHINYGEDIEQAILAIQNLIWKNTDIVARYSSRYLSIKILEGDHPTLDILSSAANLEPIQATAKKYATRLERLYNERIETIVADAKYGFITGALGETMRGGSADKGRRTSRIDRIITNRILGFPIFLLFMWAMFQATFSVGAVPAEWIEMGMGWLGQYIGSVMPVGALQDLIVDGVIGGVGGVLVFLPNILVLFMFISIMEDTGYMARAAFIMDKLMHKIGLHGKSFIPLLMGFGCNVPAIMATRTLESRKDRLLTILIIPFMSCSARFPVYILLISAFFTENQGLVLFSIYLIGILVAVLSSLALKRLLFRHSEAPFVMELPPYRIPTVRSIVRHMWNRAGQYLRKMGSVILVASVLIWALGYYPKADDGKPQESYIQQVGHAVEPAISPLGFDWQIGVSLVTGLAAKEVVVSTMAVLAESDGDTHTSLPQKLQNQKYTSGPRQSEAVFTPLVAYNMMIFMLLYFPCIAVIAAIRKEAGMRWAVFTMFYTTALAWIVTFAVYQIGSIL